MFPFLRTIWIALLIVFGITESFAEVKVVSIPLPRQSQYLEKGLQAGMGVGSVWMSNCQARYQWRGTMEYSYNKKVSGGFAARMFGGDIDSSHALIYARYFTHLRYHTLLRPNFDWYFGPEIGFDNINTQAIRNFRTDPTEVPVTTTSSCQEAYAGSGVGLGLETGFGWVPFPLFGVAGFGSMDITLPKHPRAIFGVGFGFNIHEKWKRLQDNLAAAWIHLDVIKAFPLLSESIENSENSVILGFSIGF
jgi:hypothetical protein